MSIGSEIHALKDRRLAEWRCVSGAGVDESQLRSRVVLEQVFIVRTLKQVFVRSNWSRSTRTLLRNRLLGYGWCRGHGPSRRRYELDQQRVVVRRPAHRVADSRVDRHAFQIVDLARG